MRVSDAASQGDELVPGVNIALPPEDPDYVRFAESFGHRFLVTIDTEEEFNWGAPLDRDAHSLHAVPALARFVEFCSGFGVAPVFLIDYPVACASETAQVLRDAVESGRAEVGVHLHPWVSPPHDEEVSEFNSYAGNLPAPLEREKFRRIRDAIAANLGTVPVIYRAGRYGVGPASAEIMADHGIAIDSSVRALFDYAKGGGPNFRDHPLRPYWLDRGRKLLELPVTSVFWGPLRQVGRWLYPRLWRFPRGRGLLSRAGLLERIPLTPEGISVEEARRAIDMALDDGLPVLVFSFHSPSLAPGHTPYVRSAADLDAFYDWWRAIFAHLERRGVRPCGTRDILAATLA